MGRKLIVLPLNDLQRCARLILSELEPRHIEAQLRWLLQYYEVLNYKLGYGWLLWRARKCDASSGYQNLKDLSYPPYSLVKAGRLNNPGAPVLYATFNVFTALAEVEALEGDYVHIIGYKMIRSIRSCFIGEYINVHRSGRALTSEQIGADLNRILNKMPPEEGRSFVFTDAFLSSILRDTKAASKNYLHSRILGTLLLQKQPEFEAMHYPSVAMERAMNVAIKPKIADQMLKVTGTCVIKVNKKYDYGIFDFSIVRNAKAPFHDDLIRWG